MKKRIICTILVLCCVFGTTAVASEPSNASDTVKEMRVPEDKVAELESALATSVDYESQISASHNSRAKGLYEENDTVGTAYPYSQTQKIQHEDGEPLGHFNCYYAYTNLETEDDVDYFKINVNPNYRYVAVLKNVWLGQVRNMRVYYKKADGNWYTWTVTESEKKERQSIAHFTPKADVYYLEISGKPTAGYKHDSATNWFAVEPDGRIDERPLPGSSKPWCSLQ